jgi:sugar O-acyltransferase (sialic acid O-acetyltransferase NeuD family)
LRTDPIYCVYGASGYGREVMPLAREQLARIGVPSSQLVFVDDNPEGEQLNGHRVLRYSEFLRVPADARFAVLAIANSAVRDRLSARCAADGVQPWTVAASNVVTMDDVSVGEGAVLSSFVTLTSNLRIGKHFQANIYSYIAHDCVIGDFVTFAPRVNCNGNVVVEDHAYIGTGAVIKQGQPGQPLVIGRGALVGMGAVVTRSVPADATVVGNPAKPFLKD